MYDVEFGEVRLGQMGSGVVRLGPIESGGVISHTGCQLWDTGARAPSTFNIFLLHFGVNLTANNPSIV